MKYIYTYHKYIHIYIYMCVCIWVYVVYINCLIYKCILFMCSVAQSCLTLWDAINYGLPGSSVYGILQARNTEAGYHFLLYGIFPTQELNLCLLCLLHWQADSLLLHYLESPICYLCYVLFIVHILTICIYKCVYIYIYSSCRVLLICIYLYLSRYSKYRIWSFIICSSLRYTF